MATQSSPRPRRLQQRSLYLYGLILGAIGHVLEGTAVNPATTSDIRGRQSSRATALMPDWMLPVDVAVHPLLCQCVSVKWQPR
ncbi:hypothetical protein SPBR_05428 [Sporothrix brasiliensis 5110]|uniref:Uncharacterized protein n=1 Tax=Sporothrix brasiliensis 5110 TaxID=1398154 RepID=A0A0C2IJP2_9PEZI|nr:uncharacterized protein SPBR_05428 [Sporothrix brasiliensis 5110]KIH87150.1 hypothetical protein SPBR_05428 [Sporothrix brasiliensis 5110]